MKHRGFNTYDGIPPNVLIIERLAGAYVEYKYLELILVHIIVQLARFCHALGGRDKCRARPSNAECLLNGWRRPTRKMAYGRGDGCT
jgi:hypothetical protein